MKVYLLYYNHLLDPFSFFQITSANFIKRLSEEFAEYIDLIQPIQVAIYEMKLGLSAALSGALERQYLKMAEEENTDGIFVSVALSLITLFFAEY